MENFRELEAELDAAENAGVEAIPLWPWILATGAMCYQVR
jgi:hypothetical protein